MRDQSYTITPQLPTIEVTDYSEFNPIPVHHLVLGMDQPALCGKAVPLNRWHRGTSMAGMCCSDCGLVKVRAEL